MKYCYPAGTDWSSYGDAAAIASIDPGLKIRAEALAWMTFRSLTGRRVATCPVVLRPCTSRCSEGSYLSAESNGMGPFIPYIGGNGQWYNITCGHRDSCSCTMVSEIRLPSGAGGIDQVVIDGAILPASAYRIDNGSRLVRQDGGAWPLCQDMSAPAGAVGTFTVSYYQGAMPTDVDNWAVGILAAEFLKASSGAKGCRLPKNVTQVTRQGVSYEVTTDMFANGLTGIQEVDIVIRSHNPNLLKSRPRVFSPDVPRGRMKTGR